MWHADRGRLLLRAPCSVPLGLAYVLLVEANLFFRTCRYFSGLFSNIPRYFLDFAYGINVREIVFKACRLSCDKAIELRQYTFTHCVIYLHIDAIRIYAYVFLSVTGRPIISRWSLDSKNVAQLS